MPNIIHSPSKTINYNEHDGSVSSHSSSEKSIRRIRSIRRKASNIYQSIKKKTTTSAPSARIKPGREGIAASYSNPRKSFLQTALISDGNGDIPFDSDDDSVNSDYSSSVMTGNDGTEEQSLSDSKISHQYDDDDKYLLQRIVDSDQMPAQFFICNCVKCKISPYSVRPKLLQGEVPK